MNGELQTIVISDWWPHEAGTNRSGGLHWSARKRIRDRVHQTVTAAALSARTRPVHGRAVVTITREYGGRRREMDRDNVWSCAKPIVDALTEPRGRKRIGLGIIRDDREEFCDLRVQQRRSEDGRTRCVIEIRGAELVSEELEAMELQLDTEEAIEAIERHEASGSDGVAFEDVKDRLGL